MRSNRDIATLTRRSLVFYLLCTCVFLQIAATERPVETDAIPTAAANVKKKGVSSSREPRIDEVEKTAGGNSINNKAYDVDEVIEFAKTLMGTPHVMGGYSSKGIDCSGLVKLAYDQVSVDLPRSSHDQAKVGTIVKDRAHLKRGDIVFFHSTYKKNHLITHTGIYIGNNEFIHASSKRGVTISKLDSDYYKKHYLFATRLAR